jgi:metal-responsive CopG/Arc/MetJ family transcriptional regulator
MEKVKAKYKHVSIPDKLIDEIDRYIQKHSELDFRSRAQVVIFALRKLFVEK